MMIPSCCVASNGASNAIATNAKLISNMSAMANSMQGSFLTPSTVTGTIFGQRKGRVNFCIQDDPASPPLLLLEFAMPTHLLIKEMESGLLRITLECDKKNSIANDPAYLEDSISSSASISLFSEPVWSMYCNGRKVGFAMKKTVKSDSDPAIANFMSLMQSVTTGAGVIPYRTTSTNKKNDLAGIGTGIPETANTKKEDKSFPNIKDNDKPFAADNKSIASPRIQGSTDGSLEDDRSSGDEKQEQNGANCTKDHGADGGLLQNDVINALDIEKSSKQEDELIYMRAKYERVVGSPDSAAFHMINPDGTQCQELSIFLTRS
ncbi:hypothetical protein KP509_39G048300 [Ceratopteris richardii]|nr:hypothetical protein KP509_39G048300 [Ceratopteris richardii]